MRQLISIQEYLVLLAGSKKDKRNKYNNTIIKDEQGKVLAHSKLELSHKNNLLAAKRCGAIKEYEFQKTFVLMDAFTGADGKKRRAINYIADHYVVELSGKQVVYDSKGRQTQEFRNKRKLFEQRYPHIEFRLLGKQR